MSCGAPFATFNIYLNVFIGVLYLYFILHVFVIFI